MSNDQPLILSIETATRAGGVAVARGEAVLAAIDGDAAVSHSTNLLEMINESLRHAAVNLAEVDLFAVAVGPGSFTGLRIGLATAKAFAAHLRRDVVGVPTLAAVAHASQMTGNIVALLPAGRGEVFAQRFTISEGVVTSIDDPQHLSPRAVAEKYAAVAALNFAGEGVAMIREAVAQTSVCDEADADHRLKSVPPTLSLAPSIAVLGFRQYQEGKSVAPDDLRAVYVRASDAEINERWQQQKLQQPAAK